MTEKLIRGLLKYYAKTVFFFYYKKIKVIGLDKIPNGKPIFFLPNHQNALIDPLLIATSINGFATYLTRASVFKKPFIAKILRLLGLLPIYRVRDGYGTLNKNQAIFDECIEIFDKNGMVLAFPEATHNLQRRIRPLSKGFTRIVFQELESKPDSDLQIVPIGLNYQKADSCPDSVAIIIGDAIPASNYSEDMNVQKLRTDVQAALEKLTTHIPQGQYSEIGARLSKFEINYLNPQEVNENIAHDFVNCVEKEPKQENILRKFLKFLLIVNLAVPYLLWKYKYQPKIKEIEFVSTLRYTVAMTLVPLYLLLIVVILSFALSLQWALLYLIFVLALDLLYIKT